MIKTPHGARRIATILVQDLWIMRPFCGRTPKIVPPTLTNLSNHAARGSGLRKCSNSPGLCDEWRILKKPSGNRCNLTNNFRVLVKPVFFIAAEIPGVRVYDERAIFDSATGSEVGAIAFENNVDWLLPKRFRRKVKGCLSASVDHDN